MAGDGEEAGLAADFVDGAAEGFFFVGRCSGEFGKIEDGKAGHFGPRFARGLLGRVNVMIARRGSQYLWMWWGGLIDLSSVIMWGGVACWGTGRIACATEAKCFGFRGTICGERAGGVG